MNSDVDKNQKIGDESSTQPSKSKFRTFLSNAKWAYSLAYRAAPLDFILTIIIYTIRGVFPTIIAYYTGQLIDLVINVQNAGFNTISQVPLNNSLIVAIIIIGTLQLSFNSFSIWENYLDTRLRRYTLKKIQIDLYKILSNIEIQSFENPQLSNAIQRGKDNIDRVSNFFKSSLQLFASIVSIVATGYVSFISAPELSILIVLLSIPNNIFNAKHVKRFWNWIHSRTEKNRKLWFLRYVLSEEEYAKENRILNSNKHILGLTDDLADQMIYEENSIFRKKYTETFWGRFLSFIPTFISPFYFIDKLLKGQITIGDFSFYSGRLSNFASTLDWIMGLIIELADLSISINQVRFVFEMKRKIISGRSKLPQKEPPSIEFRDVWFKYPNSSKYALKGINLVINPQEEIALVGENGAGKTTLIKLLFRFYDTTKGKILINGIPIEKIDLENYYKLLGCIFQDYNFYGAMTVKENIAIGDSSKKPNLDKVKQAASMAEAKDFIEKLPLGYETIMSKQFSGGTNLSVGQMQKIALARMFYRNAPILILDEPTSSIDAQAEYRIFNRIYKFINDKTVIIISHRFSTVRNAQKIYVLKGGEIVERGSHNELLKMKGLYAKTFALQAQGYR